MPRLGAIVLAVVVLAIAGCGGDDDGDEAATTETTTETTDASADPDQAAQDAVQSYFDAIVAGDYETACELQSEEGRETMEATLGQDCPEALESVAGLTEEVEVLGASIDGETGAVEVRTSLGRSEIPVVLEDGQWRVESEQSAATP